MNYGMNPRPGVIHPINHITMMYFFENEIKPCSKA